MDQQVAGIHRAASGGHQAARAVACGLDHRVGNVDRSALAIAEHAVCVLAIRINSDLAERQRPSVGGKNRRIRAIKIRLVAFRIACLDHCDVGIGSFFAIRCDRVLFVGAVLNSLGDLDFLCRRDFCSC